jgi:hypothetical protein
VDGAPNLQVQARTVSGTSRTRYVVNGARTSHRFPVVRPSGTSLTLDFEVFGDYNNLGEEATLFLEGVRIGSLGALGGDCVLGRTSFFLPPSFADFLLADGVVEVSVQNSTNVDPSCPSNEHIVRLSYVETPFPLRFRDTFVGGSDQRGFHVRNSGTAPLTLRGIVPGDAQFRASPTTGVILPRHELLVMGEFRPQAAGTFLATMRIQSDDPDAPEIGLMFQGRSLAAPALDVALGEITADLVAGEILTREVALRNLGGSTLEARWLAVSDWHAPAGRLPGLAALAAEGEPPLPPPGGPPLSDGMDSASPLAKAPAPLPTLASARARVLIVEDFAPWGRLTNELLLDSLGMPYDRVTSAEFETHDLSPYSLVILPSDQTDLYYVRMHAHGAKLAAWVEQGGVLDAHLAAWGSNIGEGSLMIIPGGTHAQASLDIRNRLAVPRHPLVAGLADPFEGTYASHGVLLDLPQDALVVTRNMSGAPTLATYRLGAGLVIASTHPYEYGLNNDQPTGRVLLNLLPFAMAGSGQWLRAAPERMSVGPAGAALARFTLDATGLEPGEYAGSLQLTTNDPLATWRAFPVSVRVADVRGTLEVAGDALDPSERRRKLDVRLRLPSGHRRSRVRVESVRLNGVPAVPTRSHDSEDDDEEGDDDLAAGGEAPGAPGAALAPADGAGHGRHGTHVRLRFDRAAVLATLPDSCRGELLLTGALAGGGRFLARDSVRCVERRDRDDDDLVAGGAGAASAVAAVPASPSLRLGPNPMLAAGTLRLELALPRAGPVEVQVFSLDGRLVRDVAVGERAAGTHGLAWDGRDRAGRLTPAGVYLVRVRAPGFAISRRVVRVR